MGIDHKLTIRTEQSGDGVRTTLSAGTVVYREWSGDACAGEADLFELERALATLLILRGDRLVVVSDDAGTRTVLISMLPPSHRVIPEGHRSFHAMVAASQRRILGSSGAADPDAVVEVAVETLAMAVAHGVATNLNEFPDEIMSRVGEEVPVDEMARRTQVAKREQEYRDKSAQKKDASPLSAARRRLKKPG